MAKEAEQPEQLELFSDKELGKLQGILVSNYEKLWEKQKYIPEQEQDEEFQTVDVESKRHILQADIFSDDEYDECQKASDAIVEQHLQEQILEARKLINPPYYENPKNDNEQLFNYQYEYLKHGDQNAYGKLLELALKVIKRLIWRWLESHRKVYWDDITQDEKAMEALVYVLRRYSTRVGWYCSTNFITILQDGVRHVTQYDTKINKSLTFVEDVSVVLCQNQKVKSD